MIDWILFNFIRENIFTGRIFGSDWFLVICLFRGGLLLTDSPLSPPSSLFTPFALPPAPPPSLSGEWGPPSPIMPTTQPSLTTEKTEPCESSCQATELPTQRTVWLFFLTQKCPKELCELFCKWIEYYQQFSEWEGLYWNRTVSWFSNALWNWIGQGDEKSEKNLFRNILLWPLCFSYAFAQNPTVWQVLLVLCVSLHVWLSSQPNSQHKRSPWTKCTTVSAVYSEPEWRSKFPSKNPNKLWRPGEWLLCSSHPPNWSKLNFIIFWAIDGPFAIGIHSLRVVWIFYCNSLIHPGSDWIADTLCPKFFWEQLVWRLFSWLLCPKGPTEKSSNNKWNDDWSSRCMINSFGQLWWLLCFTSVLVCFVFGFLLKR